MKKSLVFLSILLPSLFLLYFSLTRNPRELPSALLGKPAPGFNLTDLEGKSVSLESLKGKPVVLNFWSTWCGPCVEEIPGYVAMQKKYGPRGLVIVGVSMDSKGPAHVKQFALTNGMNYTLVMGDEDVVEAFGNFQAIPTTFLISREGRILNQKTGAAPPEEYEKLVKWALD